MLFVKVENDGFGLGAQRRTVTGSHLPEAKRLMEAFFAEPEKFESAPMAHKVARTKIGKNGEWNLSGERYQATPNVTTQYETVEIGNVVAKHYSTGQTAKGTLQSVWALSDHRPISARNRRLDR